jgi:hypothetical protein
VRWLVLLGLGLAGCRSAPAVAPAQAPVVRPSAVRAASVRMPVELAAAPAPESEPVETAVPALERPSFARPEFDPETELPLRATVRTIGSTYESVAGDGVVVGSGASAMFEAFVLDDGATTSPRRVQLACEHEAHRLAIWVDAADLMVTVRDQTLMVARPKLPKRVHDRTAGIRVEPGAPLLVQHRPKKGLASVRYEGAAVDAIGFVSVAALDVVYVGERADWELRPNAEVIHDARLHDRPAGAPLARLLGSRGADVRVVETLGPREGKWRLVRYHAGEVQIVGWIDKKHLRRWVGDDRDTSEARSASPAPAQPIVLARGTALVGESGDVIGVVTRERPFECAGECTSSAPMVRVDACAGTRTVQAPRG